MRQVLIIIHILSMPSENIFCFNLVSCLQHKQPCSNVCQRSDGSRVIKATIDVRQLKEMKCVFHAIAKHVNKLVENQYSIC